MVNELKRSAYAAVGAGSKAVSTAQRWWNERDKLMDQAADTYNEFADHGQQLLERTQRQAHNEARDARSTARKVPGIAPIEGELRGAKGELPLPEYDDRTAADITATLPQLTQRELHKVEGYELTHRARSTVLNKIEDLRGDEPWPGYDELTVSEIIPRVRELSGAALDQVIAYERKHRNRSTITGTPSS